MICLCSCSVFFRWGLLVTAPVDSWPKGTERIRGMLGSVGCRIYRATPITLRYDRWMDPTPPMLVSAVHSWCVCAMGVSCVSQLLPLPLPAITIFFRHGKKSQDRGRPCFPAAPLFCPFVLCRVAQFRLLDPFGMQAALRRFLTLSL